jgi:transcription elongation factor Elf1
MVEALREQWRPELSWNEIALLSARLDTMLRQIRKDRNIIPPMFTCPKCGRCGRSTFMGISINAMILAVGHFGIASKAEVKELSKLWEKYRKERGLDSYGKGDHTISARCPCM